MQFGHGVFGIFAMRYDGRWPCFFAPPCVINGDDDDDDDDDEK